MNDFPRMVCITLDDTPERTAGFVEETKKAGLIPCEFYVGMERIAYSPLGEANDHNTAIYRW